MMTKEEIREFVAQQINDYVSDPRQDDNVIDEYVEKIVTKWEDDAKNAANIMSKEIRHLYDCGCDNPGGIGCDRR